MLGRPKLLGKAGFVAVALIFAAIGAHTLNPRELFHEMYPLEPVKQDAFHICDQTDPTFVRAVGVEREACYNKMPHIMAVAMGRTRPGGALTIEALSDPSREAELLMTLAAIPPRQPITVPRSFSNTAWVRALTPPCDGKPALSAAAAIPPAGLPPPPGSGRAAALDSALRYRNPPVLPPAVLVPGPSRSQLPVIAIGPDHAAPSPDLGADSGNAAAFSPLPAADIGDYAPPAIVPLAPSATRCGGA